MFYYTYETLIGPITLEESDGALRKLLFAGGTPSKEARREESLLLSKAAAQLGEYLAGQRRAFDLPLAPRGTPFQRSVWEALNTIPYGETRSYGQIAAQIGNPKACRAVGLANNRNPLPVFIPCHRVVGADGSLTGYGGGLPIKQALLKLEQGQKVEF